jgi:hypothetical protein
VLKVVVVVVVVCSGIDDLGFSKTLNEFESMNHLSENSV